MADEAGELRRARLLRQLAAGILMPRRVNGRASWPPGARGGGHRPGVAILPISWRLDSTHDMRFEAVVMASILA